MALDLIVARSWSFKHHPEQYRQPCRNADRSRYCNYMPCAPVFRRRTTRLTARLAIVLALLIAQLGAQVHAYSHLCVTPYRAAVMGTTSPVCADCLAFTPLFSAAHGSPIPYDVCHSAPDAPVTVAVGSLVKRLPLHAFRSRAPPSLV